jgi:hypothetical protein
MQTSKGTFPVGSMWRRNPIPACNCDSGKGCEVNKSIGGVYPAYFKSYAAEAQPQPVGYSQPCSTGTQFPVPCPRCYGQAEFGAQQFRNMWAVVDEVRVPNFTGEFVLRWRWDTEQVRTATSRPIYPRAISSPDRSTVRCMLPSPITMCQLYSGQSSTLGIMHAGRYTAVLHYLYVWV